jgi:hypothetical protein
LSAGAGATVRVAEDPQQPLPTFLRAAAVAGRDLQIEIGEAQFDGVDGCLVLAGSLLGVGLPGLRQPRVGSNGNRLER